MLISCLNRGALVALANGSMARCGALLRGLHDPSWCLGLVLADDFGGPSWCQGSNLDGPSWCLGRNSGGPSWCLTATREAIWGGFLEHLPGAVVQITIGRGPGAGWRPW